MWVCKCKREWLARFWFFEKCGLIFVRRVTSDNDKNSSSENLNKMRLDHEKGA